MTVSSMSSPAKRRRAACLFAYLLLFLMSANRLLAQQDKSRLQQLQARIQSEKEVLEAADPTHVSTRLTAYRWAILGTDYANAAEFFEAEKAYTQALQLLRNDSPAQGLYAGVLEKLGYLYLVYGRFPEALSCRRAALAVRQQLGVPLEIARSQSRLAEVELMLRKYKQAEAGVERAYQSMLKLEDPEKTDLVSVLVILAYARCAQHRCEEGIADARQAVAISNDGFQPGSLPMGAALAALGSAELKSREAAEAGETTRRAVDIFSVQFAPGDPRLTHAMSQYRDCLIAQHKKREAQEVDEQIAAIDRQEKQHCANCAVSVYGLGLLAR